MKALNPSSPLFRFFRQTLSKKPPFSPKKTKKSPGPRVPRDELFHSLYSKFFGKCSVKTHLFPKKTRFFPLSQTNSLSGLLPGRGANWPLFSEKNSKFFRIRPSRQVRDTTIHRWSCRNPPRLFPPSDEQFSYPVYSLFFGKRSEKNGLFFKKNEKMLATRPLYRGYRQAGWQIGPCFLKKTEFFLERRLRATVRIPHGSRFSEPLKCLSTQCFFGQMPSNSLLRKPL